MISPPVMSIILAAAGGALLGYGIAQTRTQTRVDVAKITQSTPDTENKSLRLRIAFLESMNYERKNSWHSAIDGCKDVDDHLSCEAFTESNVPIAYHCDKDGCVVDCGGRK